jgi:hypothetical protein
VVNTSRRPWKVHRQFRPPVGQVSVALLGASVAVPLKAAVMVCAPAISDEVVNDA